MAGSAAPDGADGGGRRSATPAGSRTPLHGLVPLLLAMGGLLVAFSTPGLVVTGHPSAAVLSLAGGVAGLVLGLIGLARR